MAEITYYRGDSYPIPFEIVDKETGDPYPITDFTFAMTVHAEMDPLPSEAPEFTVSGVITDGPGGAVGFTPTTSDTDLDTGVYWYDVQMTDTSGNIRTIAKDKFNVVMDITK